MNKMFKFYKGFCNEYIEWLIEFDLQYRECIQLFNMLFDFDKLIDKY